MNVKELMRTDIPAIGTGMTFYDAKERMIEEDTSGVVVKADEKIVGMVTETDIFSHAGVGKCLKDIGVEKHMSVCEFGGLNPCLQVFENSSVDEAMKIMAISGIHHLLVWGEGGELSGVISSKDVLKTME
ncbi:CBS domain-containing protein [archaeon]|nr:CBS domain-containing protein [archaeon]